MTMTHFNPFHQLINLPNQLLQPYEQPYGFVRGNIEPQESVTGSWTPQVDIFEDAEAITMKVEVPEVEAKDVDVKVEGNTLTLRGERKLENAERRDLYHRVERSYGQFTRSFTLPTTVELGNISAICRDGVLRIVLPKKSETRPKQIKVQVGTIGGDKAKH